MSISTLTRIDEICSTISETYRGKDKKVILINTSDVLEGKILNFEEVENKNLRGQFKKTFKKNDILFSEIRPANKRFAFVNIDDTHNFIASTKLMILRPNLKRVLPEFLYYILSSDYLLSEMQHLAETRSGTFPQITFSSELGPFEIELPDINCQRKIVSILKNIDEKIELNNEINDNLSEQALNLYENIIKNNDCKEFDLIDLLVLLKDGTHNPPKRIPNGVPLITGITLEKGFISYDKMTYISIEDYKRIHKNYQPIENDLVITKIGTVGKVAILRACDLPICIHCNSALLRFNNSLISQYWAYWLLQSSNFKNEFNKRITNTVQDFVSLGRMEDIKVLLPTSDVIQKYNPIFQYYVETLSSINIENQRLSELRDSLLPKLMSGEIDVDSIEL